MYRNRRFAAAEVAVGECPLALQDLLFCPETSGGLLLAVAPDQADALVAALAADGRVPCAQVIGRVVEHEPGTPRIRLV